MSYIVKNCPAYDYEKEYDYHICKQHLVPYEGNVDDCQNCTNCVIKQVIEKCKENLSSLETYIDIRSYECTMLQDVLDLFDIEEINK